MMKPGSPAVSVRAIEAGDSPQDCNDQPSDKIKRFRAVYGGSLRQWVNVIRGRSCERIEGPCDGVDNIGHGNSKIKVEIRFPRHAVEELRAVYQDLRGQDRNLADVPKEVATIALHDAEGNRATAYFKCGDCGQVYYHKREGETWSLSGVDGGRPAYRSAIGDFPIRPGVL